MLIIDKVKALRGATEPGRPVGFMVSRDDAALLSMVAKRYHVSVTQLERVIFETGLDVLADECGMVRK